MPKIIPELRERFVAAARRQMLDGEDHDVTIRQVARDCRTAVGTVYNYFPSKEALLEELLKSAPEGFTPMYYRITSVRSLG